MYIPIGSDMSVRDEAVIGIFDLDNTTCSKHTRAFLKRAEDEGQVIPVTDELPKAFVLTREFTMTRVYLTQFSTASIEKRSRKNMFDGRPSVTRSNMRGGFHIRPR